MSRPRIRFSLLFKITALTSLPILGVTMAALFMVNRRLATEVNETVAADLARAALAFEGQMAREGEYLERVGVVIARDPKFFALLTLPRSDRGNADFGPTLLGVLRDFQHDAETPVFDVTDERGIVLARAGKPEATGGQDLARTPLVAEALQGKASQGYLIEEGRAFRVAVVPIMVGGSLMGTLTLGQDIDSDLAERLKATTRSDVIFVVNGKAAIRTTGESALAERLASSPPRPEVIRESAGKDRFLVRAGRLVGRTVGGEVGFVLLRSLDHETAVLTRIVSDLYLAGAVVIVLALLVGLAVSTGITRPVRKIVEAANEMRAGNYDFPLDIRSHDEMEIMADHFEAMRESQRHEIERLGEIDRMKSDFITIASHEILTPVTAIRAYTDMMAEGSLGAVTDHQREGLEAIRRGADSLTRLARDLTNMSLIDNKRLPIRPEPVDVGALVEDVAAHTAALAGPRGQKVRVALDPELTHPAIDAACLSQALMNVTHNAVRFTPDGGTIEIGARRTPEAVEIWVTDTGIGISTDDFERIFAKIVELKDVNLHSSGTTAFNSSGLGLGLSIARGIVEAHGGAIQVDSELGSGSTFTVVLPLPDAGDARSSDAADLPLAS